MYARVYVPLMPCNDMARLDHCIYLFFFSKIRPKSAILPHFHITVKSQVSNRKKRCHEFQFSCFGLFNGTRPHLELFWNYNSFLSQFPFL